MTKRLCSYTNIIKYIFVLKRVKVNLFCWNTVWQSYEKLTILNTFVFTPTLSEKLNKIKIGLMSMNECVMIRMTCDLDNRFRPMKGYPLLVVMRNAKKLTADNGYVIMNETTALQFFFWFVIENLCIGILGISYSFWYPFPIDRLLRMSLTYTHIKHGFTF